MSKACVFFETEIDYSILCERCYERRKPSENPWEISKLNPAEHEGLPGDVLEEVELGQKCESCQAKLIQHVCIPAWNVDVSARDYWDDGEKEELTIPPIDFDKDSDLAIAQWIANMNPLEADIAPWTAFVIFRSGQIIKKQMETDEVVEDIQYALANMLIISDVMLAHIEMTHGDFFEFLTQHGDRHVGVRDCLKEVVNNEPTERN